MIRSRLRDDNGSLVNTLVFITVGFLLTALMTGWMTTRISTDYAQAQSAQIRSAIDAYSHTILETINVYGPASVTACPAGTTLTSTCSKPFKDLKSFVTVTSWAAPAADGTIVATLVGSATVSNPVGRPVTTKLKLSLSNVGSYLGLDPVTHRPLWTKATGGTEPTALWDITPVAG